MSPRGGSVNSILGDRVLIALRTMIATGVYRSGQRIVERDVAERLGTSRGPVREALRKLESEGLVEMRPYAGAHVAGFDRDEVDEILALRRQVEYYASAGAALRASDAEIADLRRIADDLLEPFQARDLNRLLEVDLAFHLAICEASHHATLAITMRTLYPRLAVLMYPSMFDGHAEHTAESFRQAHYDLVDPIEARDVDRSLAAVDAHLDEFYVDLELEIDGGRGRAQPGYLRDRRPRRPSVVRRRLGADR